MRQERPALFFRAGEIEALINDRRRTGQVYLTRFGKPLAEAINGEINARLDFGTGPGETCDEGYCWT